MTERYRRHDPPPAGLDEQEPHEQAALRSRPGLRAYLYAAQPWRDPASRRTRSRPTPAAPPESPEWALVLRALRELAGFDQGVFYDVPRDAAPAPLSGSPVYLEGSAAWYRYLALRRRVDDHELKPLIAFRPLPDAERLLAADWGTSHANTFLVVEPRDPGCDLTDTGNEVRRRLESAARPLLAAGKTAERRPDEPWTRATELGALLRETFGRWTYWTGTRMRFEPHHVTLMPWRSEDTLAGLLYPHLRARFPQHVFDETLERLYRREPELFGGSVTRSRMPFRTRLGLPILHDPRCVDRALRRLVNDGQAFVYRYDPPNVSRYGPGRPVPAGMSEDEFALLTM